MSDEISEGMNQETYTLFRSLTNITPSPLTIGEIEVVRNFAKDYGRKIIEFCPDSREKSLAKTKLEESVMWAVKAMVLYSGTLGDSGE
jgi:hypothetical protein